MQISRRHIKLVILDKRVEKFELSQKSVSNLLGREGKKKGREEKERKRQQEKVRKRQQEKERKRQQEKGKKEEKKIAARERTKQEK